MDSEQQSTAPALNLPLRGAAAARALGVAPAALPSRLALRAVPQAEASDLIAADIARRLTEAVQLRGRAVLAVSGGRSPLPLFAALAAQELPWSCVDITLVDERAVPDGHVASNATLVRQALLQGHAAAARFHPWPAAALDVKAVDALLDALGPADVTVLGLGTDGHTASLFPGAAGVEDLLREVDPGDGVGSADVLPDESPGTSRCVIVRPDPLPPEAPYARLTQTPAHLVRSRHLLLPLSGDAKRATLVRALQASARERWRHCPIGSLLHQTKAPVEVWIDGLSTAADKSAPDTGVR